MSYVTEETASDALEMVLHFQDEITNFLVKNGEASADLYNDYPDGDSHHHENHVDREYTLCAAADVIDELRDYLEEDSGMWEGLQPEAAISAKAAYTYGNAVMHFWGKYIEKINEEFDLLNDLLLESKELSGIDVDDEEDEGNQAVILKYKEDRLRKIEELFKELT